MSSGTLKGQGRNLGADGPAIGARPDTDDVGDVPLKGIDAGIGM